jgi:hypothetical protein
MRKNLAWVLTSVAILGVVMAGGCKSKSDTPKAPPVTKGGVDENKSIADIKAEIEKMDQTQLKDMALKYKKAIEAKTGDITKLADKIKQIPLTEALGPDASKLKTELETITKSVAALKERLNLYIGKLKEMKVETKEFEI